MAKRNILLASWVVASWVVTLCVGALCVGALWVVALWAGCAFLDSGPVVSGFLAVAYWVITQYCIHLVYRCAYMNPKDTEINLPTTDILMLRICFLYNSKLTEWQNKIISIKVAKFYMSLP